MSYKKLDDKGFTLVELIVALAVMSLVMIAVVGLMIMNTATNKRLKADSAVQSEAGELYDHMADTVMQANEIKLTADGTTYENLPATEPRSFINMKTAGTPIVYNEYNFEKMVVKYTVTYNSSYAGSGVPAGTTDDECTVTYELNNGKMYVYRTFKYMTKLNDSPSLVGGKCEDEEYLYAADIETAKVKVYEDSNAMEILINYNKNDRTFSSDNYIKVRNSFVIKHLAD